MIDKKSAIHIKGEGDMPRVNAFSPDDVRTDTLLSAVPKAVNDDRDIGIRHLSKPVSWPTIEPTPLKGWAKYAESFKRSFREGWENGNSQGISFAAGAVTAYKGSYIAGTIGSVLTDAFNDKNGAVLAASVVVVAAAVIGGQEYLARRTTLMKGTIVLRKEWFIGAVLGGAGFAMDIIEDRNPLIHMPKPAIVQAAPAPGIRTASYTLSFGQ